MFQRFIPLLLGLVIVLRVSFSLETSDECVLTSSTSRQDREALFEYLVNATLVRDAAAPIKYEKLGLNVKEAMLREKKSFIDADTDQDLFYALVRLSNVRKDRHLSVKPVEDGIWLSDYWGPQVEQRPPPIQEVSIRFAMDYNDGVIFVSDTCVRTKEAVKVGDTLIRVNDIPFDDYVKALEPYVRYSTTRGFQCKIAERMNQWNYQTPPSFYSTVENGRRGMKYTLKQQSNALYSITLPFQPRDEIEWMRNSQPSYPNFTLVQKLPCFTIYLHTDKRKLVVLLVWYGFGETLVDDIQTLMGYAQTNDWLRHSLILDLTDSRGGSRAPYALQHLSPRSFKTTFGNLRFSDISKDFIRQQQKMNLGYYTMTARKDIEDVTGGIPRLDDGTWLMDWIETSVIPTLEKGKEYTENVPFKLTHAPMNSNGILYPALLHFTGEMVALFGPFGGSQVDQLASILVDNKLAHTIGMSTGGFSNTWDWSELLTDRSGKPIASYMWSIGQSIRPNGEVLEGNPPQVDEYVPQTHENYLYYRDELVVRAMRHLGLADDDNNV